MPPPVFDISAVSTAATSNPRALSFSIRVTDEAGAIAFPAGALDSRGRKKDLDRLRAMIQERGIERAVVGLPLHLDGRRGPEAENAVAFAQALEKAAGIPVDIIFEQGADVLFAN